MENLIFEILKMAGFIVVLFLCCLWLVKDKRSVIGKLGRKNR